MKIIDHAFVIDFGRSLRYLTHLIIYIDSEKKVKDSIHGFANESYESSSKISFMNIKFQPKNKDDFRFFFRSVIIRIRGSLRVFFTTYYLHATFSHKAHVN